MFKPPNKMITTEMITTKSKALTVKEALKRRKKRLKKNQSNSQ